MSRTRAHRRNQAHLRADLERMLRPGRRATVIGYAWWWRYEICLVLGLGLGMYALASAVGTVQALIGVAVTVALFAPWPPTQQAVLASAWRIITPHRLRAGFVQARIHTRNGRLPTIVRTTQQPFGERVLVWCPAGTSAADFRSARRILTAACWAADISVTSDDRHAHLVTIDVIRDRFPPNASAWPASTGPGPAAGRPGEPERPPPG